MEIYAEGGRVPLHRLTDWVVEVAGIVLYFRAVRKLFAAIRCKGSSFIPAAIAATSPHIINIIYYYIILTMWGVVSGTASPRRVFAAMQRSGRSRGYIAQWPALDGRVDSFQTSPGEDPRSSLIGSRSKK